MIVGSSWLRSPRTYPCPRAGARARPTTCPRRTQGTGQYCVVSTGQSDSSIMLQVLANQKSVSVAAVLEPSSPGLRPQDAAGPAPGEAAVPRPPPRPSPDTSARAGSSPDQSQLSIGVN